MTKAKTLGELKKANYQPRTIKEELRQNLIEKLNKKETVFEGIHGFEHSVVPELERAILSKHNINLLGLRGQAKTRLARLMIDLLDEYIPVIEGSEVNDDPMDPISAFGRKTIEKHGDDTPVSWMNRSERFSEKLATPDVTVADLIGDVDPIKAANMKLSYSDPEVIHFGMIPRAHRCIFVINELPDLQARIQVSLFNILQEGDIQIRGFKLRMPLDLQFIFTANPEDYTNRGSIVTPLKDRIGSQILTHYPQDIETAKTITAQEAKPEEKQKGMVKVPELAKDVLEQISFEARDSEYVDEKSGISARMSITAFQNLLSTAERRALQQGSKHTVLRFSDFMGVIPSITGKIELVYEGEQEGAAFVAHQLIDGAAKSLFPTLFPKIEKLEKKEERTPYDDITQWFFESDGVELEDSLSDEDYRKKLDAIKPLKDLVEKYHPEIKDDDKYFLMEFALWGLAANNKLSKERFNEGLEFKDLYGGFIGKL